MRSSEFQECQLIRYNYLLQMGQKNEGIQDITEDLYILKNSIKGSGAFAVIYQGYDKKKKSIVAVKKIKKSSPNYKRQQQVLQKISKANHKYIMKYYRSVQSAKYKDCLFLSLQMCEGGTLRDYITRGISELQTLRIFKQIVQAMKFLHGQKEIFIHRDLKPQNIMLDFNNNVKIADFGTARQYSSIDMTRGVGTINYCAPELKAAFLGNSHDNAKQYKTKCDVWSVGMILHEMLTGSLVKIQTVQTKIQKINMDVAKESEWLKILNKMLVVDEQKRWQFEKILHYLEEKQTKIKSDIFEKFGYKYTNNQSFQAKNEEEVKATNLHFQRSIQTLKLATEYLHFIKEKHHFYKKVIEEIGQNQEFCLSKFYKIFINYLMIGILKKKKEKLLNVIESYKVETPFGVIQKDCFQEGDHESFRILVEKHEKYLKQDIGYWSRKLREKDFKKRIKELFEKQKKEKPKILIENEEKIIESIDNQIERVSLNSFQNAFSDLCELREFKKIYSEKLSYRDTQTYAFILFLKDIEKQIPDKLFQQYDIVRKKKKQLLSKNRKELDTLIQNMKN